MQQSDSIILFIDYNNYYIFLYFSAYEVITSNNNIDMWLCNLHVVVYCRDSNALLHVIYLQ